IEVKRNSHEKITPDVFHKLGDTPEKKCEIEITFKVDSEKLKDIPKDFIINNELTLKKVFKLSGQNKVEQENLLKKHIFMKRELNYIPSLKASELKTLFKELKLGKYTNVEDAINKIKYFVFMNFNRLDKSQNWYSIKWTQVSEFLPLFEYYGNSDYGNPQKLIENTLSSVYRTFFYNYDKEGNEVLKNDLEIKQKEIRKELDKKIKDELKTKVKNIIGKVETIAGDYDINFAEGFRLSNIIVDFGTGRRSINNIGEGSKKRLFLAIMEWDKEIRSKDSHKRVIRGYDEPDSSLHYSAQKEMYYTLEKISKNESAKVQPLICTHSISMIDRTPAKSINHIVHENGVSTINILTGSDDSDIKEFLDKVSEISGMKNSSIFFERCFVIIEGPTEYNALPILYKKYHDRSLSEDGIVLLNIEGNGSWKNFLKLLVRNKSKATLMLLDTDTNLNGTKNEVNIKSLKKIGFDQQFLNNSVILIGDKEFEDVFPNNVICRCLNKYWPKINDEVWIEEDIEPLRDHDKFSDSLKKIVAEYINESNADIDFLSKPEFGLKIADVIEKQEIREIDELSNLFTRANEIIR
ncbi:MAG: AAA family ATPase, partial [Spirochaetes bacterium]|nr:AAA family ATPase [Spirochaetota bacterium]